MTLHYIYICAKVASDVGYYDRAVIQEILKDVAQTQQVDTNARYRFKVVVINEADGLSRDAQAALRRTMEKYSPNVRLILVANTTSKIISPIRSRCLLVRIPLPSIDDVKLVLTQVAQRETADVNPSKELLNRIATDSGRNMRRALLMLEAVHSQTGRLDDANAPIAVPDWEAYVETLANMIVAEQSPSRILQVRPMLYELLTHCIPATHILRVRHGYASFTIMLILLSCSLPDWRSKLTTKSRVKWSAGPHSTYVPPVSESSIKDVGAPSPYGQQGRFSPGGICRQGISNHSKPLSRLCIE